MAEIDDKKPIVSVKSALSLFEQKTNLQDCCPNSSGEKEKEFDLLMKDLVNCKLQLEIKESAYTQAVVKLDIYQRTLTKLSTQLKLSEADRNKYMEEFKKSKAFIAMLESEYEVVIDQLVDCTDDCQKLLRAVDELKHRKKELLQLKTELTAAEESKVAALMKVELAEKAVHLENEKNKELLVQVSELNEAICSSNLAAIEEEKVWLTFFTGMEEELQAATEAVIRSHEQLEQMKLQLAMMKDLGNEFLEKTFLTDYYQFELIQAKDLLATTMEMMQTMISDERNFSASIEAEAKRLEEDLRSAREEVSELTCQVDKLTSEIQYMKDESSQSNKRELELQVEVAMLKSKIHGSRSRIAAAEAAEARAMCAQTGLHLAVQELALEAETAKKEAESLKLEMCSGITVSIEEYESLIQKAMMADEKTAVLPSRDELQFLESKNRLEIDVQKEELDAAKAEISDLKFTLEETMRRAEMAENAKSAVEAQLRKWREQQKQRRVASEALQEQSGRKSLGHDKPPAYKHRTASLQEGKIFNYVPLGKVLNMKF